MLLAAPAVGADELPAPPDVKAMPQAYSLMMGSQPVKAVGLRTKLPVDQARAFYESALKKQGWVLTPVPWLAESEQQREALRKALAEHPEHANDPQATAMLSEENFQRFQNAAREQLYAVRGKEHLLLAFTPSSDKTLLTITRWEGSADNPLGMSQAANPALAQPGVRPSWPAANPCCGGSGEVPQALRTMPSTIPSYPNGRMISSGSAPGGRGRGAMSETYLTADGADQVADYYRHQMAYNGWTESERPAGISESQAQQLLGPKAGQFRWDSLSFRDDHGLCTIVVTEYRPTEGAPESPLAGALLPAPEAGRTGPPEHTVVGITYVESQGLSRKPNS